MRMQEHLESTGPLSALFYKLFPATLGAVVMAAVDLPANKRELFLRVFVAGSCSLMLGDVVFDYLDSTTLLAFLDAGKRMHHVAVDFIVGAVGWTVVGAVAQMLRRFRNDPAATIREVH